MKFKIFILLFSLNSAALKATEINSQLVKFWIQTKRPLFTQKKSKTNTAFYKTIENGDGSNVIHHDQLIYLQAITEESTMTVKTKPIDGSYSTYNINNLSLAFTLNEIDTVPFFLTNNAFSDLLPKVFFDLDKQGYIYTTDSGNTISVDLLDMNNVLTGYMANLNFMNEFQRVDYSRDYAKKLESIINEKNFLDSLKNYHYSPKFDLKMGQYDFNSRSYSLTFFPSYRYWPRQTNQGPKQYYSDNTGFHETEIIENGRNLKAFVGRMEETSFTVNVDETLARRIESKLNDERIVRVELKTIRNSDNDYHDPTELTLPESVFDKQKNIFIIKNNPNFKNCFNGYCYCIFYNLKGIDMIFEDETFTINFDPSTYEIR
jgi:hypothetical protein